MKEVTYDARSMALLWRQHQMICCKTKAIREMIKLPHHIHEIKKATIDRICEVIMHGSS